jgi:hypothetical protein
VLVIDRDNRVTVQLDRARMAMIDELTETWLAHLRERPTKLERHIHRGQLAVNDPQLWDKITERVQRGFMGEMATAAYLRAPYKFDINDYAASDVDGVEVRTVGDFNKRLITHEYDKPAPYVLAVADYGTASVVLRGWLHLRHCNQPEHWVNTVRAPAFFTPATALHPMHTLRHYYQQRKRRCTNGV